MSPRALCILALLCGTAAYAQEAEPADQAADADAQARQLYENGATLYDEGRYEQAITAFEASYELSGRHPLLLNIANAQERLGQLDAAVDTLNDYRIYADADTQVTLERRIRVLEERIAERPAEPAPAAAAPAPAPAPAPQPAEVPATRKTNSVKWVALGTGAAVAGAFGTSTALSYSDGRSARDDGDREAYDSARNLNTLSGVLAGVGGALVVVGIALPASRTVSVATTGQTLRLDLAF